MPDLYYYFMNKLDDALRCVGDDKSIVWFYERDEPAPKPWKDSTRRPPDAVSALVATPSTTLEGGTFVQQRMAKDPVLPPPPPLLPFNREVYLRDENVIKFFGGRGGIVVRVP